MTQEMKQEDEKRANSIAEAETAENKIIDARDERKKQEKEKKKRKRKEEIAKRLKRDTGHIIDLEV